LQGVALGFPSKSVPELSSGCSSKTFSLRSAPPRSASPRPAPPRTASPRADKKREHYDSTSQSGVLPVQRNVLCPWLVFLFTLHIMLTGWCCFYSGRYRTYHANYPRRCTLRQQSVLHTLFKCPSRPRGGFACRMYLTSGLGPPASFCH